MKRFHFLSLLICLFTAMTVSAMQNEQEIAGKVMEAVRRGDQNTALQILNQALSADPNKLNLVMMRANVHEEMGNYQQAKSDLQRLIDAAPQIPDAWIARARVHIREGNGKAALDDVNQTLSLQNNHP